MSYLIEHDCDEIDHIATGSESLREFGENVGRDNLSRAWLLDSRDVWVKNSYYSDPPQPHPEDDYPDESENDDILVLSAETKK